MKQFSLLIIALAISGLSLAQPTTGSGSQPGGADGQGRCAPVGGGDGILIALAMAYVVGRSYLIRIRKLSED